MYLRQNCNAGTKMTNKCGYYAVLLFYVSKGGIANLLSVPALKKAGWTVSIRTGKPVQVFSPDGLLLTFKRDTGVTRACPKDHVSRIVPKDSVACVETGDWRVRGNMEGYTVEEFTKAKAARDALAMMAHPQDKKMKHLVSPQNVTHMPFTSTNFANGRALFGPDRGAIRGKTVRQLPSKWLFFQGKCTKSSEM